MNRCSLAAIVAVVVLTTWGLARAGSRARYALVVGNDHAGVETLRLPDLRFAEREAHALHDRLIRHGNFEPARTRLLLGGGRAEILRAAAELTALRRQEHGDNEQLLFGFFFTGHGLEGRLLTADEPLTNADLVKLFEAFDGTFNIGFFDACHAGSFRVLPKGMTHKPYNPIRELPREVLGSTGTMWFASSSPDELSYEDPELGGLFTHFFVEAFTRRASAEMASGR